MSYNIATLNPAVSDWVAFTPTGSWTTNVTYTGFWRRNGDVVECRIKLIFSGVPDSSALLLNLPAGLVIDTGKLATLTPVGGFFINDVAATAYSGTVLWSTGAGTSSVVLYIFESDGNYVESVTQVAQNVPIGTIANNDSLTANFSVPIVGWSSNIQTIQASTEYASNGSVADADDTTSFAYGPAGSQVQNATLASYRLRRVRFLTAIQATDTLGIEINLGSGVWVPIEAGPGGGIFPYGLIQSSTTAFGMGIYARIDANTVDVLVGRYQYFQNSAAVDWAANSLKWRVVKRSGLAAGEVPPTVYASYNSATTSTLANATIIQWDTKLEDTHNAVTTGAGWKFTAPISGLYEVKCMVESVSGSWVAGNYIIFRAYINGNAKQGFGTSECANTGSSTVIAYGSRVVRLAAGEYLQVKAFTALTTTMYNNDADFNWIQITRIGG
jgi:hypothetical protein